MSRRKLFTICALLILAVAAYVSFGTRLPKRPENVPADAIFVKGSKAGWWQSCAKTNSGAIDCQVVSVTGRILVNGEFLPYDGGALPMSSDLVLEPNNRYSSVYRVCLKNGRILLPKSMYQESKKLLDSLEASRH